ncbi:MAG: hypothetical protein HYV06_02160 [Deltaproteobacteria bacterium]|nr:hypothetical protein [Deltaproteobacteria bacterium]
MNEERREVEKRSEDVVSQMEALVTRVAELEARLATQGAQPATESATKSSKTQVNKDDLLLGEPDDISEEVLSWASRTALLPRLATLCFLMVIALALRTVTDNQLINTLAGSALGMGYAAALILAGWYLYRSTSPLAPVFAACGALLMATIVVETHMRFLSLPLVPAYITLIATGIAMTVISYQFKAFLPVSVGTLGMCLAGAAIDYPHPYFPYLSMILWTANLLGFYAASLKRCSWLRWTVLIVTLLMLQLWGFGLGAALSRQQQPAPGLAPLWFLPVLGIFVASYLAISVLGIVRSGSDRVSRFDFSLPTVIATWSFAVAHHVVGAQGGNLMILGWTAIVVAALHAALAWWLAGREIPGKPGTNALVAGGAVLLLLGLPKALGQPLFALPLLAAAALGLALTSRTWSSGGVRFTSYLLQVAATGILALFVLSGPPDSNLFAVIVAAAMQAAIAIVHYRWCRTNAPPADSEFFGHIDRRDLGAAALLMAALVSGFFLLRSGVYLSLRGAPGDLANSFRCSQSIIINLAAIGLMLLALIQRNKELRNLAILVTVVGAIRVFLYDMFGTHGVPLVLSVFSFGLAAAVESIMLGRWQHQTTHTGRAEQPAAQQAQEPEDAEAV